MKKKNLLLIIPAILLIILLKSCTTSRTPAENNSTNKQLLERIGQLEDENKELKIEIEKLKNDNNILKSSKNVDTKSIEKTPVEAKTTEEATDKPQTTNKDTLLDDATNTIKNNFKNDFDVESEVEGNLVFIHMYPKGDVEKAITALMLDQTNTTLANSWDYAMGNLASMSKTFNETTGKDINIMIHNPINKENIVYSTYNNAVIYNFMNE